MESLLLTALTFIFLLLLSAFFSGSETALFSISEMEFKDYRGSKQKRHQLIAQLFSRPKDLLVVVLTGNLFVNILLSTVANSMAIDLFAGYGPLVTIAILTPVIIFFAEVLPKSIAIAHANAFRLYVIYPIHYFSFLIFPVKKILSWLTEILFNLFRVQEEERSISKEELKSSIRIGQREGILKKSESAYILNILKMESREAQHVMLPRNDTEFIEYNSTISQAFQLFRKIEQNVLPVYRENRDNIVGFLFLKDIIGVKYKLSRAAKISRLIQPANFFPYKKDLLDLLREIKESGIEVAVILDEFGGTAGIVTLKNIISFITGYGSNLDPDHKIRKININSYRVKGDILLDDFNDIFHTDYFSVQSETLSGFLTEHLDKIASKGDSLILQDNRFTILTTEENRIDEILFHLHGPERNIIITENRENLKPSLLENSREKRLKKDGSS